MTMGITSLRTSPFRHESAFGIDAILPLSLFDTTGTVVHLESRVPTEWKKKTGTVVHLESRVPTKWETTHLPFILLAREDWTPSQEVLCNGDQSREFKKTRQINAITGDEAQGGRLRDN
jgi:hypothetical protein